MNVVETDKQVYIFNLAPYQSNADYLEVFKAQLIVSKSHNVSVLYYLGLSAVALQENTTSPVTPQMRTMILSRTSRQEKDTLHAFS